MTSDRSLRGARSPVTAMPAWRAGRLVACFVAVMASTFASAAFAQERVFEMNIVNGSLPEPQRLVSVTKDDAVRLRVSSNIGGALHMHGYRLEVKLAAGETREIGFKAYATGRFPLEWHGAGEKVSAGKHLGPEFAVLEVRPK